jgi:hypothetical protein
MTDDQYPDADRTSAFVHPASVPAVGDHRTVPGRLPSDARLPDWFFLSILCALKAATNVE